MSPHLFKAKNVQRKNRCSSALLLVYKFQFCCWQGRTTLLLGPPGAGKSVLLQLLAGHFKNSAFCRVTGDVKYNGKDKKEFVIQRTAGLVDQYDEHIANLTVHETLDFASACQVGKKKMKIDDMIKVSRFQLRSLQQRLRASIQSDGFSCPSAVTLKHVFLTYKVACLAFCKQRFNSTLWICQHD